MLNKIFSLLSIASFLFVFIFCIFLFSNSFISSDDTFIIGPLTLENQSGWGIPLNYCISMFFGYYLPLFFKIHPSDFMSEYFSYIEACFILSFILILINCLLIKHRIHFLYFASILFSSGLIFFITQKQPFILFKYEGFFRMMLPQILTLILLISIIKNETLKNKLVSYLIIPILVFLSSISSELTLFSTLIGLITYASLEFKNRTLKENLINLFYILISSSAVFIFIKCGVFARKGNLPDGFFNYILYFINELNEFLPVYYKYVFANHFIEYFLLIVLLIILKFNNKSVKLVLCFLFGILSFFFSLIIIGKTHYTPNSYWVIHSDLHIIYSMILWGMIFLLIGEIIYKKTLFQYSLLSIFLISSIFLWKNNIFYFNNFLNGVIIPNKKEAYKYEKILRLSNMHNKTALLPKSMAEFGDWSFYLDNEFQKEPYKEYQNSSYIFYINQFSKENPIKIKYMFVEDEKALKSFEEMGGSFQEKEMNNIRFTNLLNNFSL